MTLTKEERIAVGQRLVQIIRDMVPANEGVLLAMFSTDDEGHLVELSMITNADMDAEDVLRGLASEIEGREPDEHNFHDVVPRKLS